MCGASILDGCSDEGASAEAPQIFQRPCNWYCDTVARERFDSTVPRSPPAGCRGGWGRSWLQAPDRCGGLESADQPDSATQRRWAPEQSARARAPRDAEGQPDSHGLHVERWLPLNKPKGMLRAWLKPRGPTSSAGSHAVGS